MEMWPLSALASIATELTAMSDETWPNAQKCRPLSRPIDSGRKPHHKVRTEQVQREAAAREYANLRLQQPYERALYDQEMALQTRRWHMSEYQAVVADLKPDHLRVCLY
jgi:hypothetical protein